MFSVVLVCEVSFGGNINVVWAKKTNKLINIQSFDGREACRERRRWRDWHWLSAPVKQKHFFLVFWKLLNHAESWCFPPPFNIWVMIISFEENDEKKVYLSRTVESWFFVVWWSFLLPAPRIMYKRWIIHEKTLHELYKNTIYDKYCHVTS